MEFINSKNNRINKADYHLIVSEIKNNVSLIYLLIELKLYSKVISIEKN